MSYCAVGIIRNKCIIWVECRRFECELWCYVKLPLGFEGLFYNVNDVCTQRERGGKGCNERHYILLLLLLLLLLVVVVVVVVVIVEVLEKNEILLLLSFPGCGCTCFR